MLVLNRIDALILLIVVMVFILMKTDLFFTFLCLKNIKTKIKLLKRKLNYLKLKLKKKEKIKITMLENGWKKSHLFRVKTAKKENTIFKFFKTKIIIYYACQINK